MYLRFQRLLAAMNVVASAAIMVLMVLICADVIGRAAFNRPLYGVPEIVKTTIVCVIWLQIGYTLHRGNHLRSGLFLQMLPEIPRRVILVANCVLGCAIFAIIAWSASGDIVQTFVDGDFEGEYPVRIPVWPVWLILVCGATVMSIEYIVQAYHSAVRGVDAIYRDTGLTGTE
jgi:TRAP-type C4-dicarboxylate transport system permease small subunit